MTLPPLIDWDDAFANMAHITGSAAANGQNSFASQSYWQ
jgi:hypothetical protein